MNVDSKVDANGNGMFCLPEYGLKFKTMNNTIFLFKANKICITLFKNANGI